VLKLSWGFALHCDRAEDLSDLRDLLQVEVQRLGFRYFALCSHVNPARPPKGAIILHNYPVAWERHFRANNYARRDPVFLRAREQTLAFSWTDPEFLAGIEDDQRQIMTEAAEHGLIHGVTIPLHGPNRYSASCSLVSETAHIEITAVHQADQFAKSAYEAGCRLVGVPEHRPSVRLSRRERQCMQLVAIGKDDETIAIILGIESATVRNYVDSAKHRLGVSKRTHAVARAIYVGAINLEEIFYE